MKLIVDSGSTKADWIAIDDNGKVLFTTQTLGLNPEILENEQIIERLNDRFDIVQSKKTATHLFFYGAGCGTDRMKLNLSQAFQGYFTNAIVSVEEEKSNIEFAIKTIIQEFPKAKISVDTFRSEVAQVAINAGASLINDISGFNFDPKIVEIAAKNKVPYILMHLKGSLETMHDTYRYESLIQEVKFYFQEKIDYLISNNVIDIILDPGFGFSKSIDQNYELFDQIEALQTFNRPLLIGISRKSMIYKKLNCTPEESLDGTIALNAVALTKGASILRVHDVKEAKSLIDQFRS